MIIQRVAAAVKRHDWSLFLLEVLVVVVGLFFGLQVDDWNESRKDQPREQLYPARSPGGNGPHAHTPNLLPKYSGRAIIAMPF